VVFRLEATPREEKLRPRRRIDGRATYITDGARLLRDRCPDEGQSSGGGGYAQAVGHMNIPKE
jgi:hypothetical protein